LIAAEGTGGVKIRPLKELLADIMKNRIPVDFYADTAAAGRKVFVIRRWYEGRNPEVGIR
jgi:hypothetical protein